MPRTNPADIISMRARRVWQDMVYFKQKRILEFIEGYIKQHGIAVNKLTTALMHMFDLDSEVAIHAISVYRKITRSLHGKFRENPVGGKTEIYGDILAIEAIKGKGSLWPNEKFRHDFKRGSKIYGLPDGSILIKSTNGKNLWKQFEYTDEDL